MLLYYIRHGEPVYQPDILTPLGERQAEALAKRLALYGVNKIFTSTSGRAIDTAKPTADILRMETTQLDHFSDDDAFKEFTVDNNGQPQWIWDNNELKNLLASREIMSLGENWHQHPSLAPYKAPMDLAYDNCDKLLKSLGYEHIRGTGKYKVINHNDDRVAIFAHAGFSKIFLSAVLDIPFPITANHFEMCHSGMTVIEFNEDGGISIPKILTLSADSHIYREGLPTKYNGQMYF